ncbi:hypothetical protein DUNSADRAFT_10007 [Dunaliella salina]|uniref:Encoded protein n=1 Tax=Dunaliella salina TaxID=3046 RepID=A0ABQ7GG93_DUNSA|nr:hypothetical protein DUNSADRAFT_10007 [Dunaliella salina]|eukprot:KAF5833628.1 hypothetical protein DUNSADRAFT_10007 [Dunaliella salina]
MLALTYIGSHTNMLTLTVVLPNTLPRLPGKAWAWRWAKHGLRRLLRASHIHSRKQWFSLTPSLILPGVDTAVAAVGEAWAAATLGLTCLQEHVVTFPHTYSLSSFQAWAWRWPRWARHGPWRL